jgi:hypothetical protein
MVGYPDLGPDGGIIPCPTNQKTKNLPGLAAGVSRRGRGRVSNLVTYPFKLFSDSIFVIVS